jgi:hypothetical protein
VYYNTVCVCGVSVCMCTHYMLLVSSPSLRQVQSIDGVFIANAFVVPTDEQSVGTVSMRALGLCACTYVFVICVMW